MGLRRRTRIVATIGPALDGPGRMADILRAGIDVARINLSHGAEMEHKERVERLRSEAGKQGRTVAVLADLPGPKLRAVIAKPIMLVTGSEAVFTRAVASDNEIAVTDPELIDDVQPGHRILLDDGRIQLRVTSVQAGRVVAMVEDGGELLPKKGINLPDTPLSIPAVTPRDIEALKIAAAIAADWIALSFVRSAGAADELRAAAQSAGLNVPILAKLERPEAVAKAAQIVAAFDGVMVARGDLGVEIPLEQVPAVQKRLIAEARAAGKPVVTATDMLDSMRTNPRPTRAEASDVANAIYDGTDAVMLSGETAVGLYPIEAVKCMDRIARSIEAEIKVRGSRTPEGYGGLDDDLARGVCHFADNAEANAIVVPTLSGKTAREISRHRPNATIVAPVPSDAVRRQLALTWGIRPVPLSADLPVGADRIDAAIKAAWAAGELKVGYKAVVLAGHPQEGGPRLPTVRLLKVGENGSSEEP